MDVRKLHGEQRKLTRSKNAANTQEMADTRRLGKRLVAKAELKLPKTQREATAAPELKATSK